MDNGARTYKMCDVRRPVNINSNHGIRVTFTSDDQADNKLKDFVKMDGQFSS